MITTPLPPVYVTYDTRRKVWVLMFEYVITLDLQDDMPIEFKIPQNFEFDLASIPRIIWPLIGSFELSLVAPLIHDYLYQFHGEPKHHRHASHTWFKPVLTRAEADSIFLDLMLAEKVTSWKAKAAYRAVRLFAPRW